MSKPAAVVKAVFRGIARMDREQTVEFGGLRASGVPAILFGVAGIVAAAGLASFLTRSAERLPETLSEARGLAQTLKYDRQRLPH
jgi:hypothetical protein